MVLSFVRGAFGVALGCVVDRLKDSFEMLKNLLQSFLRRFGIRVSRVSACVDPVAPFNALGILVHREVLLVGDRFRFVGVGVRNAAVADALGLLICKYRLRGYLLSQTDSGSAELGYALTRIRNAHGTATCDDDCFAPVDTVEFTDSQLRTVPELGGEREEPHSQPRHRGHSKQPFGGILRGLASDEISLLYIDALDGADTIVNGVFEAGYYPRIISYEWTEMPPAKRFALKMRLLDNGYRFIDIGADVVCTRSVDEQR